jgi:hypothetical protein
VLLTYSSLPPAAFPSTAFRGFLFIDRGIANRASTLPTAIACCHMACHPVLFRGETASLP